MLYYNNNMFILNNDMKQKIQISAVLASFLYIVIHRKNLSMTREHFGWCCSSALSWVKKAAKATVKAVKKVAKAVSPAGIIKKVFKWCWKNLPIFTPIRYAFKKIKNLFTKLKKSLKSMKDKMNNFVKKGKNLPKTIAKKLAGAFDKIKIKKISINLGPLKKFVKDKVLKPIKNATNKLVAYIKKALSNIPDAIKGALTFLLDKIKSIGKYIAEIPVKLVRMLKKTLKKYFKPLIKRIKSMIGLG